MTIGHAADQPQWGQYHSRNMLSEETGLPESCDPATGKNIKWSVPIGTQSYATAVVAQGRVIIGTNNDEPRDPKQTEDGGVVLCLDEKDGHFCWQFVSPKLENDPYLDWPHIGLCSPATVENGRVYIVSNRAQVLCMSLPGHGEILWRFDMPGGVGIHPHDSAHSSILIDGDPTAPKKDIHSYWSNRKESPSVISGMPVFYKNRIYLTLGGDIWWGKDTAWLKCINSGRRIG